MQCQTINLMTLIDEFDGVSSVSKMDIAFYSFDSPTAQLQTVEIIKFNEVLNKIVNL